MTYGVSVAVPDEPAQVNLSIAQGATFRVEFTWLVDGVPRDLRESAAKMAFARRPGNDVLTSVSSTDGEISFNPERAGVIIVTVPAAKTALLGVKEAHYDLLVIEGENVYRVAEGVAVIRRAVTTLEA